MKTVAGIDVGAKGALAIITEEDQVVIDYSDDFSEIKTALLTYNPELVVLEQVSSMHKQGVKSMFSFGTNYGRWQGLLEALGIPYILVPPKEWQKAIVGTLNKGDKTKVLNYARRRFPDIDLAKKKHDGRADALCMALYASQQINFKDSRIL